MVIMNNTLDETKRFIRKILPEEQRIRAKSQSKTGVTRRYNTARLMNKRNYDVSTYADILKNITSGEDDNISAGGKGYNGK